MKNKKNLSVQYLFTNEVMEMKSFDGNDQTRRQDEGIKFGTTLRRDRNFEDS